MHFSASQCDGIGGEPAKRGGSNRTDNVRRHLSQKWQLLLVAHLSRTLVIAATDTTSNALSRILHLLSLHPDAQDKLRDELKEACEDNEELTHDQLVSLPYLEAVCRETLRLYVTPLSSPHQF